MTYPPIIIYAFYKTISHFRECQVHADRTHFGESRDRQMSDFDLVREFFDDAENAELADDSQLCAHDAAQALDRISAEIERLRAERDKWHRVAMDAGAVTCVGGGHLFPLKDEVQKLRSQLVIDKTKLRALFADHYWDSFQSDKDIIMKHVDYVLSLVNYEGRDPVKAGVGPAMAGRDIDSPALTHTDD